MPKRKKILRRNDDLKANALSPFDLIYNMSFNLGGKPSEIAKKIENIIETNHLESLDLEEISIARYLGKPCIIHRRSNQFSSGIWFPIDWFFTIHMKSPYLAKLYLKILLKEISDGVFGILELIEEDYIDSYFDHIEDDFDEEIQKEIDEDKAFSDNIMFLIKEIAKQKFDDIEENDFDLHKKEFPKAAKMIIELKNFFDKNRKELKSYYKRQKTDVPFTSDEFAFAGKNQEEYFESRMYPYELIGLCFCNVPLEEGYYPNHVLFDNIDSKVMEAGYDTSIESIYLYKENGYKKTYSDYWNFVKQVEMSYDKITNFNYVHNSDLIWKTLRSMPDLSFQNLLLSFTKTDTLKAPKQSKLKEENTAPAPLPQ